MTAWRFSSHRTRRAAAVIVLCTGALAAGPASAGGLIAYEVGTADVGFASAGYNARAQDASTVFTNPGGSLDTSIQSTQPVALGGRGNLVGSFNNVGVLFLGVYGNWKF